MKKDQPDYHEVTMHDFKSNIARYLRDLDRGRWDGLVVKRYNQPVGLFFSVKARQEKRRRLF